MSGPRGLGEALLATSAQLGGWAVVTGCATDICCCFDVILEAPNDDRAALIAVVPSGRRSASATRRLIGACSPAVAGSPLPWLRARALHGTACAASRSIIFLQLPRTRTPSTPARSHTNCVRLLRPQIMESQTEKGLSIALSER